jgi:mRNA interferase RelE/StbE
MGFYKLVWKPSARKELRKLPREAITRVVELVESLAVNPHPPGSLKLSGTEHAYRVRTGDYRVVYEVQGGELIVHIIRVGHRREVYR